MSYPMRRTLTLSLIGLLLSLLPACGKKGPLYLPQDKPAVPVAAPAIAPSPPPVATPP